MTIRRSSLSGCLRAPPSKSYTHRAFFCAALAQGESRVESPLICDDTMATFDGLSRLGVTIERDGESTRVTGFGKLRKPSEPISCKESGTTLRFMTAVCSTIPHEVEISGGSSLLKRPVKDLADALQVLGAACTTNGGYPPVHVKGPLKGGAVTIPGGISSQYVSALMLAAPLAEKPVEIVISGRLQSRSYVEMTLHMQDMFGVRSEWTDDLTHFKITGGAYSPSLVRIEGDWSSAAFLLAAAATAGEKIRVSGLHDETLQADRCLLDVIDKMNGHLSQDSGSVVVEKSELKPIEVDVSDCPDLFPVICAMSAVVDGVSRIEGIRRLRIKESNRVLAMTKGLDQMGIKTEESEDFIIINGDRPKRATIDPQNDHRIAMAFATLGLCTDEVTILDAECVSKSYPSFWSDLESLGAEVMVH